MYSSSESTQGNAAATSSAGVVPVSIAGRSAAAAAACEEVDELTGEVED